MTFRDLHYADLPLVLPNAWDVPSALALLGAGFTALGTTSFGVAVTHGTPDGAGSTRDANLRLADALRPLNCYLSIDVEDGYSADPDAVADPGVARPGRRKTLGIDLEDRPERGFILDQNIEGPRERIGNEHRHAPRAQ